MNNNRVAVIMAGGSGERFWPLSRMNRPKQLLRLADPEKTLLEQSVERLQPLIGPENIIIATAPHLVAPSQNQVPALPQGNVQAEPHKRNTAGCLVWVAANILAQHPDARETVSMAVLAADHRISPDEGFRATVDEALTIAETLGGIVTIGIKPDRPETGYGYIETVADADNLGTDQVPVRQVKRFCEKPDRETAEQFLAQGGFFWNSGTFFWTLDTFLTELEAAAPNLYAAVYGIRDAIAAGDTTRAHDIFAELPSISIDYALMEKAKQVYVAEAAFDWDDVGAWDALERTFATDQLGNVSQGDAVLVESGNSIVVNEHPGITTCLLGVDNLVVVVTGDAILICPKDRAQHVRSIVEHLKSKGSSAV